MLFIVVVLVGAGFYWFFVENKETDEMTEAFIQRWLTNDNGILATYILDGDVEDEDEVKGREALSETLGLWMTYALEKQDKALFEKSYQLLRRYFLEESGFVFWKLNESGETDVSANALIDDIRIAGVLYKAGESWNKREYIETASRITAYAALNNENQGILTDFYEREDHYASEFITLSYIDGQTLQYLRSKGTLAPQVSESTIEVLKQAPMKQGFYPKTYNVEENHYVYDESINMVDQALVALHQSEIGIGSKDFLQFIRSEMEQRGLVHGIYDRKTKQPLVEYESPAIYALLIMYCLEIGDVSLAEDIRTQMKQFLVTRRHSKYYGGYSIHEQDTHIFDNVLPMLAEQQMEKQ
ncbi:hypothetical protein D7Z54_00550 [Salibacterium salarium]|uniref:Glycosyl hydrolases family 8 n=1 Tax=Salibacterium salarium TaxID=284579 RepID=A0A3R9QWS5_9BACI|nr:glycosyl hydrolase family 8 [Salibacterium salarium]RSL35097.1 hypothetical protein D7Z54_00550 [Salibacterium salarium]